MSDLQRPNVVSPDADTGMRKGGEQGGRVDVATQIAVTYKGTHGIGMHPIYSDSQECGNGSITIILAFASRLMAVLRQCMGRSPKQVPV